MYPRRYLNQADVVVSMTTYPKRFEFARRSLKSIIMQAQRPTRIILFLFADDYEKRDYFDSLLQYGVEIESYPENLKSFLKIIPVMERYSDDVIVSADDDMYYRKNWLSQLIEGSNRHPNSIVGHRGIRIAFDEKSGIQPYLNWRQERDEYFGPGVVLTSVGGILYPATIFSKFVLDMKLALALTPNNDDFWIYFVAVKENISQGVISSDNQDPYYWFGSQQLALWRTNVYENNNDKQLQKLINYFGQPINEKLKAKE
jgi:hypothetical protein